jgi:putative DNA primase/helicase
LLALDELGVGDPREVAAAVYTIANGTGKQRARRDGSAQAPRTWNVMLISSGEVSVETKIEEDRGRKARAGQFVRLLDIPADRELGHGVFDNPGTFADAGKLADEIKTAATAAYGTAGPDFVRGIIKEGTDEVSSWAQKRIEKFVREHAAAGASEQVGRAGAQE